MCCSLLWDPGIGRVAYVLLFWGHHIGAVVLPLVVNVAPFCWTSYDCAGRLCGALILDQLCMSC